MGTKKHFNILTFTENGIEIIIVTAKTSFIIHITGNDEAKWPIYSKNPKKKWKCKSKDLSIGLHLLIHSLLSAWLKTFVNPKKKTVWSFYHTSLKKGVGEEYQLLSNLLYN